MQKTEPIEELKEFAYEMDLSDDEIEYSDNGEDNEDS